MCVDRPGGRSSGSRWMATRRCRGSPRALCSARRAPIPGVRVVRPGLDYTELDVTPGIDPETVLWAALDHPGVRVTQFLIDDPSIEEIFVEKVGRRPTEAPPLADPPLDGREPAPVATR